MPHLTCCGVTVATKSESFKESPVFVGLADERGIDGGMQSQDTTRKREFALSTVVAQQANAEKLRQLLEGHGLQVSFNNLSSLSGSGLGPQSGTFTLSATGGKFSSSGKVNVSSGSVIEYALANRMRVAGGWTPTKGWTLIVWKKLTAPDGGDGVSFLQHIATGSVVVVRGASANPAGVTQYKSGVAGSWAMGNWIDLASDGDVSVTGHSNAGAAAAYDYDDLVVLPFTVTAAEAAAMFTFHASQAWPPLPFVRLGGDALPDELTARVRITSLEHRRLILDGAFRNNAAELVGTVRER